MSSDSPVCPASAPARKFAFSRAGAFLPLVIFFVFFTLYAWMAQRGFSWQDSGEFQYRVLADDLRWYSGIARAHPLYIVFTRGFSLCFPAAWRVYSITLSSGVGMAVALAFLFALVVRLSGERSAGIAAGILSVTVLGFCHMGWWMSCMAEVYTWSLAFLMMELYCLFRSAQAEGAGRWLFLLFFCEWLAPFRP